MKETLKEKDVPEGDEVAKDKNEAAEVKKAVTAKIDEAKKAVSQKVDKVVEQRKKNEEEETADRKVEALEVVVS